jgi:hypothetical protein
LPFSGQIGVSRSKSKKRIKHFIYNGFATIGKNCKMGQKGRFRISSQVPSTTQPPFHYEIFSRFRLFCPNPRPRQADLEVAQTDRISVAKHD